MQLGTSCCPRKWIASGKVNLRTPCEAGDRDLVTPMIQAAEVVYLQSNEGYPWQI